MAGLKKGMLPSSSLIEVLIAMIIILVIFSIAMTVFHNVLSSGLSYQKLQVYYKLDALSKSVMEKGYLSQDEIFLDSVRYDLSSQPTSFEGLEQLEITASKDGQKIGFIKRIYQAKIKYEQN